MFCIHICWNLLDRGSVIGYKYSFSCLYFTVTKLRYRLEHTLVIYVLIITCDVMVSRICNFTRIYLLFYYMIIQSVHVVNIIHAMFLFTAVPLGKGRPALFACGYSCALTLLNPILAIMEEALTAM